MEVRKRQAKAKSMFKSNVLLRRALADEKVLECAVKGEPADLV